MGALEGNASSYLIIEYGEHILGVSIVVMLLFNTEDYNYCKFLEIIPSNCPVSRFKSVQDTTDG